MATRYFGQPIKRNEDPRLLTGLATFTDDVHLPGMLHVAFVRSQVAHGRIRSIDTAAARTMPGVVAVYTAACLSAAVIGGVRRQRTALAEASEPTTTIGGPG